MHSAGLELTKLTYTRLEDNLIRHRGGMYIVPRHRRECVAVGVLNKAEVISPLVKKLRSTHMRQEKIAV